MEKKFLIHDHIPKLISILSSILTGGAFLFLVVPFLLRDELIFFREILLKKAIIISPLLFIIAVLLDKLSVKVKTIGIEISETDIIFYGFFKKESITFADIKKFEFNQSFSLRKKGVIYSGKQKFTINFFISNLPDLISVIRKNMDTAGNRNGYNPENIADFDLVARYQELSAQILDITTVPMFRVLLLMIILNLIVVNYFWDFHFIINLAWIVQSLFFPAAAFLISYSIFKTQVKKQLRVSPTDMKLPDYIKIFYFVSLPVTALFLFEGIMFRRFFIYYLG